MLDGLRLLDFPRHTAGAQGIQLLNSRVVTILVRPEPTTVRQLRTFNSPLSFHQWFILNCASLMRSLTEQLRENSEFINMDDNLKEAFCIVKELIVKATLLAYQNTEAPISISINTSDSAIGGLLKAIWEQQLAYFSIFLETVARHWIEVQQFRQGNPGNVFWCTVPSTLCIGPRIHSFHWL